MDHIAIMKKSWRLTDKILDGRKKIESRWYMLKCKPWDCIKSGDAIYFKDSGEPVKIKAEVSRVMRFSDLTPARVEKILREYGKDNGIESQNLAEFYEIFKNKKYCLLIFLKNSVAVRPFEIDKTGFGAMAAWIAVDDINRIKR